MPRGPRRAKRFEISKTCGPCPEAVEAVPRGTFDGLYEVIDALSDQSGPKVVRECEALRAHLSGLRAYSAMEGKDLRELLGEIPTP